jgi:hypothetical protein
MDQIDKSKIWLSYSDLATEHKRGETANKLLFSRRVKISSL